MYNNDITTAVFPTDPDRFRDKMTFTFLQSDTGRKRLPADHAVVSQLVSIMKEGLS